MKRALISGGVLLATLIGGVAIGQGSPPEAKVKTVTKRVEVPGPERIVNHDVPGPTVEVTPQACIDALDKANAGFAAAAEAIQGIIDNDVAAIEAANAKIDPPSYKASERECRAASNV